MCTVLIRQPLTAKPDVHEATDDHDSNEPDKGGSECTHAASLTQAPRRGVLALIGRTERIAA
jgi:hypothetical protein